MSAFAALNRSRGRWEDVADGRHLGHLASREVRVLDCVPDSASYPLCDLVTSSPSGSPFPHMQSEEVGLGPCVSALAAHWI